MSRLIDADEFIKEMKELYKQAGWGDRDIHFSLADVISNIEMMPVITIPKVRQDIIRCKDCKNWPYHPTVYADDTVVSTFSQCICTTPNDYCYMAERKEE